MYCVCHACEFWCVSVRVQACVFVLECGCECPCVISALCVCGGVRVVWRCEVCKCVSVCWGVSACNVRCACGSARVYIYGCVLIRGSMRVF